MTTRDAEFHTELFGENTYIFSPEDDPGQVAQTLDAIYEKQEADQQSICLQQASILYGVFCNYPKTTSTLQVFLPASNGIRVPVTGCPSTVTDATPDSTCALLSIVIS